MRKYLNFLIIPLLLNYLFSSLVFSADRADVSGITVTITNNGTISASENFGLRNSDRLTDANLGHIANLTNNGTITAGGNDSGIRNPETITILTNTDTISAARDFGINNRPEGAIGTIDNSGTISAGVRSGIWNGGTITTLTNSGNIKALADEGDYGIKNNNGTIGTQVFFSIKSCLMSQ